VPIFSSGGLGLLEWQCCCLGRIYFRTGESRFPGRYRFIYRTSMLIAAPPSVQKELWILKQGELRYNSEPCETQLISTQTIQWNYCCTLCLHWMELVKKDIKTCSLTRDFTDDGSANESVRKLRQHILMNMLKCHQMLFSIHRKFSWSSHGPFQKSRREKAISMNETGGMLKL